MKMNFQTKMNLAGNMSKNLDIIELPNIHRNRKLPAIAHWAAQISKAMSHLEWFTNTSFSIKHKLITVHCVVKDSDNKDLLKTRFQEVEDFLQSKSPYDVSVVYRNI